MPQLHRQQSGERRQQTATEQTCPLHRAGRIVHRQIDQPRQPDKGGVAGKVGGELQHAKARHPVGEIEGIVGIEGHRKGQQPAKPGQLQQGKQVGSISEA